MESCSKPYLEKTSSKALSINREKKVSIFTKQLKVLHICQRDDTATGGAVRVATEYIKRLVNYNIDAHCLFLYGSPGYFQAEIGHSRTHYLNIQNSKDFFKFRRLVQFLQKFKPQIIHHHDGLLWSHLLTFFHPGVVKVAHAHLGANKTKFFSKSKIAAWLQRKSSDRLVCITRDTCQSQIKQGKYLPNRTQVIYNGVDRAKFYPPTATERQNARRYLGLPVDAPAIAFVGRLHCQMKGTDDFLRVFALLPQNFWAIVVGDGSDAQTLKQLATTLNISDRVIFTGILDQPIVAYHAMDVFCLTSHWEPFGLVVAEAMACHVPVVGFACPGGVNELLNHETGCIIPNRDLKAMSQAIVDAVNNPEVWYQYQIKAKLKLKQNHDWQKNTSYLADLYQTLVTN